MLDRPDSTEIRRYINMMKRLIDLCTHDSSVCASYVHIRLYQISIYISLSKFKSMILTFALTETFSANICNICIASIVYLRLQFTSRSDQLLFKTLISTLQIYHIY